MGPQGHVFAFEPDPLNFALLKLNVRQNGYSDVTLVPKAVAARSERRQLFRNLANRGDHRIYASSDGRESVDIETVALDEFFAGDPRPIDFIKMDIQGAEGEALAGMQPCWPGIGGCGWSPSSGRGGCGSAAATRSSSSAGCWSWALKCRSSTTKRSGCCPWIFQPCWPGCPVEPDTDMLFRNLHCTPAAGSRGNP